MNTKRGRLSALFYWVATASAPHPQTLGEGPGGEGENSTFTDVAATHARVFLDLTPDWRVLAFTSAEQGLLKDHTITPDDAAEVRRLATDNMAAAAEKAKALRSHHVTGLP